MLGGCFVHQKATNLLTNVSAYSHLRLNRLSEEKLHRYGPRCCQTTQITPDPKQTNKH